MKQYRALSWLIVIAAIAVMVTLTAPIGMAGAAPSDAEPSPPERTALVQVFVTTPDAMARFEQTGLPAYTRLEGREGSYLLAGATPAGLEALAAAGLPVRILDPDMAGATYYLAHTPPNRPRPEWGAYGRLLLDDGEQALLRTTPQDAERLTLAGAELRLVTLTPKPLRPAVAPGAIPEEIQADPLIQAMIDQVDGDAAYYYVRQLAGEVPVWVDDAWYTITTRHTNSGIPIQKTTHWAGQQMADLGLNVEYHVWSNSTNPNVIGELPGLTNPDDIFIIGGHVDDVNGTPGADDNASGSVATLIAADILTQYRWGCTLRFALWTGEEQGLLGSAAYAHRSYELGENIVGYLDPDMIAWNTIGSSPGIDLRYKVSMPPTLQLAQLFADVVDAYDLNLVPEFRASSGGFSDHSSFWDHGYTAIMAIEDNGDYNPYYHLPGDTPAHIDRAFFSEFVKASVGTFAHMSGCLIPDALDGHVTAASDGAPIEGATVTAQAATGTPFSDTTDATGYYTRTLLSGTYTVTAEAYGYLPATATGVEVVAGQVTTRDFALESAPTFTVSGHVTELGTGLPLLAELQFEGSPVTVWTDPGNGYYEASLPPGSYTIKVSADRHRSQERPVVVTDGDQVQEFALEAYACTLLVDDDVGEDYETYYAGALAAAGQDYELWTVATAGSPTADDLSHYDRVVWLTGDDFETTLTTADQAALTSYLNGGGRLFMSGQDIGYDIGTLPFYADYLHAVYDSDDTNNYSLSGLDYLSGVGLTITGGDGAGNQEWPSDISPTGGAVAVLDYPSPHLYGGVAYQNGTYGVVYFSFGFEAIDNQADRTDVMLQTLDWLGGCACEVVHDAGFAWQPVDPDTGEPVRFEGTAAGQEPIGFAWNFGDGGLGTGTTITHTYTYAYDYAVTMTATNTCGQEVVSHTVQVGCVPVDIQAVTTDITGCYVTFGAELAGTPPSSYGWDFGAFGTSTEPAPTVFYGIEGTFAYTLTVSNCEDMSFDVVTGTVAVVCCDEVIDADFTWTPDQPLTGEEVVFTGVASGTTPIEFDWALGDGTTGHGAVVTHTYTVSDTYTVVLTATNECSTAVVAHDVVVLRPVVLRYLYLPIVLRTCGLVRIDEVTTSNDDLAVTFAPTVSGQEPVDYLWSFGDGMTSTLANPVHIYPGHGIYTASLEVNNCDGTGSDDWTGVVVLMPEIGVEPLVLEASLYPNKVTTAPLWLTNNGTVDLSFVLHETGTLGVLQAAPAGAKTGRPEAVSLTLSGLSFDLPWLAETPTAGAISPSLTISVAVTFDAGGLEPGVYTGLLDVESDDPTTPHVGVPVTLTVEPPPMCYAAEILTVIYEQAGCQITFSAQLTGTEPISVTWDFGAFGASAELTPTIDFGIDGTYPYTLTVTNCEGLFADVVTGMVAVQCCEGVYNAGFTWMPLEPMIAQVVTFTATASGTVPIEFDWVFGDGTAGYGAVVTHTYATSDTYSVVLTATNGCGVEVVAHDVVVLAPKHYVWRPEYIYLPILLKEP